MNNDAVIVDSHQHFWDPRELEFPFPPPECAILGKPYLPMDLAPELNACGIQYTVLVQAYPQSDHGNRWLFDKANESSFVAGVVAWGDLEHSDRFVQQLDELASEPKFCGIRQIVEDVPNERFLMEADVLKSLEELQRRSIPFDFLVKPRHLPTVVEVLEKLPNLLAVIDHIGKPDIASGKACRWLEYMHAIAQYPNVHCKLSGMVSEADWKNWRSTDFRFYVDRMMEWFGPDRIMFGSDWPVCLLAANYEKVWQLANELLEDLDQNDYFKVFGRNAIEVYSLSIPVRELRQV